ncbi:8909_t:CDS:2 [Cetraspora pellucida]|uniref:8909_t:CDS:1 n=1 Tax=Cetraspora pellucida TaxID=1433469 RepID=A0A9N9GGP0_9GLOM|nr:8909_t:CDS:2 [Cetraspora pellucida]
MVNDISVECNNSINDNDISDEYNNLINNKDYLVNKYKDGWVNNDDNLEAIKSLITILEPFAEATDLLGEINYDNDESAFNNDQIDVKSNIPYDCSNIEKRVRMALYNAIKHY